MTDQKLVNGLTRDAHRGALATAQSMHIRAIADDHDVTEVERWAAEVARIEMILYNWEEING